ncbi:MAG: hypothetical protein ACLU4N_24360 [Butyricimonas faecihominis]
MKEEVISRDQLYFAAEKLKEVEIKIKSLESLDPAFAIQSNEWGWIYRLPILRYGVKPYYRDARDLGRSKSTFVYLGWFETTLKLS